MHRPRLVAVALAFVSFAAGAQPSHAQAQRYQLLRVDTGLTGTWVPAYGRGGFGGVVELKLNVHDHIAVGARLEGAVTFGGSITDDGSTSISVGAVAASLVKGEYFLTTGPVRPFAGLALGLYDIVSQSIDTTSTSTSVDQAAGRYFGVGPSAGLDLGRLRLAVTYNRILGADIEVRQQIGTPMERRSSFSQSYVSFDLLIRLGGHRKPAPAKPLPPGGYYDPTGPYRPPT